MHLKAVTLKSLEYEHKTPNFPVKCHLNSLTKLLEVYFLIPDTSFWYLTSLYQLLTTSNIHLKAVTVKSLQYEHKTHNFPVKYYLNGLTKLLVFYFRSQIPHSGI